MPRFRAFIPFVSTFAMQSEYENADAAADALKMAIDKDYHVPGTPHLQKLIVVPSPLAGWILDERFMKRPGPGPHPTAPEWFVHKGFVYEKRMSYVRGGQPFAFAEVLPAKAE